MASASDHRAHAALQPADCLILLPQRLPAAVETSIGPAHYPAECTQSDAFLQPSLRARKGRANSNSFYGEEEKRRFLKLNAVTLFVTLGIVVFILLTLATVVALPVALTYIPLPGVTALVVKIGRWPILFALVTLALAVLYKYGPSRTEPRWRWITWGSVSAAVVWLAASALF